MCIIYKYICKHYLCIFSVYLYAFRLGYALYFFHMVIPEYYCYQFSFVKLLVIHLVSHIVVPRLEMTAAFVFFEIKPLKGCRLWAPRPIFQDQCPNSLIPGVSQVAIFSMGPKMKVAKSKNN